MSMALISLIVGLGVLVAGALVSTYLVRREGDAIDKEMQAALEAKAKARAKREAAEKVLAELESAESIDPSKHVVVKSDLRAKVLAGKISRKAATNVAAMVARGGRLSAEDAMFFFGFRVADERKLLEILDRPTVHHST